LSTSLEFREILEMEKDLYSHFEAQKNACVLCAKSIKT
jgi:hypothetical protein